MKGSACLVVALLNATGGVEALYVFLTADGCRLCFISHLYCASAVSTTVRRNRIFGARAVTSSHESDPFDGSCFCLCH